LKPHKKYFQGPRPSRDVDGDYQQWLLLCIFTKEYSPKMAKRNLVAVLAGGKMCIYYYSTPHNCQRNNRDISATNVCGLVRNACIGSQLETCSSILTNLLPALR
jgi:hypothetical protein